MAFCKKRCPINRANELSQFALKESTQWVQCRLKNVTGDMWPVVNFQPFGIQLSLIKMYKTVCDSSVRFFKLQF